MSDININDYSEMFSEYPDVMTVKELQAALSVGYTTAYNLVRDGVIPSKKTGKLYRILKIDVINFLAA